MSQTIEKTDIKKNSEDNKKSSRSRGLGRGLDALFQDEEVFVPVPQQNAASPQTATITTQNAALGAGQNNPQQNMQQNTAQNSAAPSPAPVPVTGRAMMGIYMIEPFGGQPRMHFDEQELTQLADSIRTRGMLQPIVVRKKSPDATRYQIVAGERRWRAAQKAGLHDVPVNIVELNDEEAYEVALIENLQRVDLNPMEEAHGYSRLMHSADGTALRSHTDVAEIVGKSRAHVTNMLRLLDLPGSITEMLHKGEISMGHARALAGAPNAEALADEIVKKGLSVRQVEAILRKSRPVGPGIPNKGGRARKTKDVDTAALENDISNLLGMRFSIESKDGKSGEVRIGFKSLAQLDDLIQKLSS